jgi:hypothetical protein
MVLAHAEGGFALDISAGVGAAVDISWSNPKFEQSGVPMADNEGRHPVEIKVFLDVTYLQASLGYIFVNGGSGTITVNDASATIDEPLLKASYLAFAVYAKYPVVFGHRARTNYGKYLGAGPVTLFPLLGLEYRLNLTYTDVLGYDRSSYTGQAQSDLDELWLEAGL